MKRPKHLLIDGDIVLFKLSFRNEYTIEWASGPSKVQNLEKATLDVSSFIRRLLNKTGCDKYTVCFTNELNFRYGVYPQYKSNRVNSARPDIFPFLKENVQRAHPWLSKKYCEADDLIGILATREPHRYMAASIDKDFYSLPVWLYNWSKNEIKKIPLKLADYNFHLQWLTGDSGDGYGGCYGIGPKKAAKILSGNHQVEWTISVIQAYDCNRIKYTWEDIMAQARMARILRHEDWDTDKQEPILWEPII